MVIFRPTMKAGGWREWAREAHSGSTWNKPWEMGSTCPVARTGTGPPRQRDSWCTRLVMESRLPMQERICMGLAAWGGGMMRLRPEKLAGV